MHILAAVQRSSGCKQTRLIEYVEFSIGSLKIKLREKKNSPTFLQFAYLSLLKITKITKQCGSNGFSYTPNTSINNHYKVEINTLLSLIAGTIFPHCQYLVGLLIV